MPEQPAQTAIRPALYLVPSALSDAPVSDVIPARNIEIIRGIRHFVVENIRSARRFLKRCDKDIDIDSLSFTVLDEHTAPSEIPPMLEPLEQGLPMQLYRKPDAPPLQIRAPTSSLSPRRAGWK